mgnify:FL=1
MSFEDITWVEGNSDCIQTSKFEMRLNRNYPPTGGLPTYTGPSIFHRTLGRPVAHGIGEITGNGVTQISNMVRGDSVGPGVMIGKDGTKKYGLYENGWFLVDREKSKAKFVESQWITTSLDNTDKTIPDAK